MGSFLYEELMAMDVYMLKGVSLLFLWLACLLSSPLVFSFMFSNLTHPVIHYHSDVQQVSSSDYHNSDQTTWSGQTGQAVETNVAVQMNA